METRTVLPDNTYRAVSDAAAGRDDDGDDGFGKLEIEKLGLAAYTTTPLSLTLLRHDPVRAVFMQLQLPPLCH